MKSLFRFFVVIIVFNSCSERSLTNDDVNHIKETYSAKAINYFYELVYYAQTENKFLDHIQKWDEKIKIKILGNPKDDEIQAVNNVVESIKELNLSVDIGFVENESDSNFTISFMKRADSPLSNKNLGGQCTNESNDGRIFNTTIYIIDQRDRHAKYSIQRVVEEEMIQGLGLACDSYTYPNSLFYDSANIHKRFSMLDKEVLTLLYDPILPINYSRENFNQDFGDILFIRDTTEKIKKYVSQNNINTDLLKLIEGNCFNGRDFLVKQPQNINVYIEGQYNALDSIQVSNSVNALNEISEFVSLEFQILEDTLEASGIYFDFINDHNVQSISIDNITIVGKTTMLPYIKKNEVRFTYKNGLGHRSAINSAITHTLFQCLIPIEQEYLTNKIQTERDQIVFDKELHEAVNLLYSDVFVGGYKRSELKELIKLLN